MYLSCMLCKKKTAHHAASITIPSKYDVKKTKWDRVAPTVPVYLRVQGGGGVGDDHNKVRDFKFGFTLYRAFSFKIYRCRL